MLILKTLVISDCHLNDNFLIFTKVLFPLLKQIITNYKVNKIVFLGDIFDSSNLTNIVLFLFKKLVKIFDGYELEIIVGNHDQIDKKNSAYDLLLLSDNIKIIHNLKFDKNYIYVPYIHDKTTIGSTFAEINNYIKKSDYKEFFIYSHNDFSSLYKFRNTFFDLEGAFVNLSKPVYFINGHNHVPVFRNRDPLYIINLGCVINLTFKDSGLFNNFLIIDDNAINLDSKLKVLQNSKSIQYYTFNISSEDEIYNKLNDLDNDNIKYVTFKVIAPNIVIDNELKIKLQEKFNIINIHINYELKLDEFSSDGIDIKPKESITTLENILTKYNITMDEFLENNTEDSYEKVEILYTLLDLMFKDVNLPEEDSQKIIETVNKYYLKHDKI